MVWVGHATVLLELGGARLVTDPLLRDRVWHLRRHGPGPPATARRDLDAVLISHLHHDHLDLPSLRMVRSETRVVAPRGSGPTLRRAGLCRIEEISAGESVAIGDAVVTAWPAEHDGRRWPWSARVPALSYLVEGADRRVWFPGDTDLFTEMAALARPRLDLALLPVWGWGPTLGAGHLDPVRAADAAALIHPRVVVPIHWGTMYPIGTRRIRPRLLVEPPRTFAGAVARAAPDVRVEVIPPGGALELG